MYKPFPPLHDKDQPRLLPPREDFEPLGDPESSSGQRRRKPGAE